MPVGWVASLAKVSTTTIADRNSCGSEHHPVFRSHCRLFGCIFVLNWALRHFCPKSDSPALYEGGSMNEWISRKLRPYSASIFDVIAFSFQIYFAFGVLMDLGFANS